MTFTNMLNGKKVGLVLGCGAVAGAAWSVPILQQLQQQLDWDAREADVLIGTSVGAVLAALLSARMSVETMAASLRGEQCDSHCTWDHDTSWGHWYPPLPGLALSGLGLLQKGWRGDVAPLTAVCGALPTGRFDMTPFRQLINAQVPEGKWSPHPDCWIMAVDNASGDRVAFGRSDAPQASLVDAVCASYAVPGWCPPVTIAGHTWLDGGIASPTSADFLVGSDIDVVIVLAPMASRDIEPNPGLLERAERAARRYMTRIVDQEVNLLRETGKIVIQLDPVADDLRAIGYNMMDARRRTQVFGTATRTAADTVRKALHDARI